MIYNWDKGKYAKLIEERGISFEEIIFHISNGALLDIIENPNNEKYKDQFMFVIKIDDYVYLVPFVENESVIFLKTIYPSRKATENYLKKG